MCTTQISALSLTHTFTHLMHIHINQQAHMHLGTCVFYACKYMITHIWNIFYILRIYTYIHNTFGYVSLEDLCWSLNFSWLILKYELSCWDTWLFMIPVLLYLFDLTITCLRFSTWEAAKRLCWKICNWRWSIPGLFLLSSLFVFHWIHLW